MCLAEEDAFVVASSLERNMFFWLLCNQFCHRHITSMMIHIKGKETRKFRGKGKCDKDRKDDRVRKDQRMRGILV
jgi:hypothetical protein